MIGVIVLVSAFQALQPAYFGHLDLRVPSAALAEIPPFAAELSALADQTRADWERGAILSRPERDEAGLILVYDAMMTLNNTGAATSQRLSLNTLKNARRYAAAGASDHEELSARAHYVIDELTLAATLRPDDRRIDSWLAGARVAAENVDAGRLSEATLTTALDAIAIRPTFNLWTAMLVFKGHDAGDELYGRLTEAAKGFVDAARSGTDPCESQPTDCAAGEAAPHNLPASMTVLGDTFLRRANALMIQRDIPAAMELASYAEGTYARIDDTVAWPDGGALPLRKAAVAKLLQAQTLDDAAFTNSDDFQRAYECSACHGRQ